MAQALYRKYRSKKLSEIVGQEHVTSTLDRAIKAGKISHAYLFTGPRGVGKTSIARILAHEVNGLPYTDESAELDIIEIDAASNRRIDEIRDLRDKVHIAPSTAKYKVYIIDEVHMLTKEAFNALLKTLEEPPAHVIFVLATTETHKLPDTIISRTQRFTFKPIEQAKVVAHLQDIAKQEGFSIDDEAARLLAEHGGGSFRDSISLLDQMQGSGTSTVTAADVERMIGIAPQARIEALLAAVNEPSAAGVLTIFDELKVSGVGAAQLARQLSALLRQSLISGQLILPRDTTLKLLGQLVGIPAAHDPEAALEHLLLQANAECAPQESSAKPAAQTVRPAAQAVAAPSIAVAAPPIPETRESSVVNEEAISSSPVPRATIEPNQAEKPEAKTEDPSEVTKTPESVQPAKPTEAVESVEWWPAFLDEIKASFNPLYGILRMCVPRLGEGGALSLVFAYPFHHKRISDAANKQKVVTAIKTVTGKMVEFTCEVDKSVREAVNGDPFGGAAPVIAAQAEAAIEEVPFDPIIAVHEIFGGGEVLDRDGKGTEA